VIVCHCRVVTDRAVREAVREGAGSLAGVCRSTGAGQDCGACVFSLKRLVCEHGTVLAASVPTAVTSTPTLGAASPSRTLSEVDVAAS
jgi:bacterioferritin-associated ferredoxin